MSSQVVCPGSGRSKHRNHPRRPRRPPRGAKPRTGVLLVREHAVLGSLMSRTDAARWVNANGELLRLYGDRRRKGPGTPPRGTRLRRLAVTAVTSHLSLWGYAQVRSAGEHEEWAALSLTEPREFFSIVDVVNEMYIYVEKGTCDSESTNLTCTGYGATLGARGATKSSC
ncbi:hypothetical protein EDB92DRAFT_2100248 [Lactarius akahatsu]|uniref:Uncharacterized protein n=1 Tax=Lactarius akahatsu TaxID=416441 RepID=A0AAD4QIC2_9AGAM|nr:hypothetical protein EDB92DRAFT_2100248 [Lactarius akahatsu]